MAEYGYSDIFATSRVEGDNVSPRYELPENNDTSVVMSTSTGYIRNDNNDDYSISNPFSLPVEYIRSFYTNKKGLNSIQPLILWEAYFIGYDTEKRFLVNNFTIPGVSIQSTDIDGSALFVKTAIPGRITTENKVKINLYIDSSNFIDEIENIIKNISSRFSTKNNEKNETLFKKIILIQYSMGVKDYAHREIKRYEFHECYPLSVGDITFDHKDQTWGRTRSISFGYKQMIIPSQNELVEIDNIINMQDLHNKFIQETPTTTNNKRVNTLNKPVQYWDNDKQAIANSPNHSIPSHDQTNLITGWIKTILEAELIGDTPVFGNGLKAGISKITGFVDSLFYKEPKIKDPTIDDHIERHGSIKAVEGDTADIPLHKDFIKNVDPDPADVPLSPGKYTSKLIGIPDDDNVNGNHFGDDVSPTLVDVPIEDHVTDNNPDSKLVKPDDYDHITNNTANGNYIPVEKDDHILDSHMMGSYVPVDKDDRPENTTVSGKQIPIDGDDRPENTTASGKQIPIDKNDRPEKTNVTGKQIPIDENDRLENTKAVGKQIPIDRNDRPDKTDVQGKQVVIPDNDSPENTTVEGKQLDTDKHDTVDTEHLNSKEVPIQDGDTPVNVAFNGKLVDLPVNDNIGSDHVKTAEVYPDSSDNVKTHEESFKEVKNDDTDHFVNHDEKTKIVEPKLDDRLDPNHTFNGKTVDPKDDDTILTFANMYVNIKNPHWKDHVTESI